MLSRYPILILLVLVTFTGWSSSDVSPVFAGSERKPSILVALLEQQKQLDQQIDRVEKNIKAARRQPIHSEQASLQTVSYMEGQADTSNDTLHEDIDTLEVYTVQDTFLNDPFDDNSGEILLDPWEGFNSAVFDFNLGLDRNVIRPVARGYHAIIPDVLAEALGNAFSNLRIVSRLTNNLLQGKGTEAGLVASRFLINSTVGLAGFFDAADSIFDLRSPPEEDAGQTLATWGLGPGPYVVLPLLPPTTIRDGVGTIVDLALDPLNYVLPFVAQASTRVSETVNSRSQTLESFQGIEDNTIDLYAAVRNAYSQARAQAIQD